MDFDHSRRRFWPALGIVLLLGACTATVFGGDDDDEPSTAPLPCPLVAGVSDASKLTRFAGAGRDVTDVQFEAQLTDLRSGCVYREGEIAITVEVPFIVSRGPANQDGTARFNYFAAIARGERVLARETFDVQVEFDGNTTRMGYLDELGQTIPLQGDELGNSYVIYIGIELTPQEMEFNRQR
ncbi:MAG: hypothetical protein WD711_10445 [Dongiaceae bacterium]